MTRHIWTGLPDPVLQHENIGLLYQKAREVMTGIEKDHPEGPQLILRGLNLNLEGRDEFMDLVVKTDLKYPGQMEIQVGDHFLFGNVWAFMFYRDGKDVVGGKVFSEMRDNCLSYHETLHKRSPEVAALITKFLDGWLQGRADHKARFPID